MTAAHFPLFPVCSIDQRRTLAYVMMVDMNSNQEWINHLKQRLALYERDALNQRRLAESDGASPPEARAKTLQYAEFLEGRAELTRQELKRR